uniref:sterol 3beta-glucosyltransferase n=1 Tax=Arcella intermedia TaxID=1963864 RepID=A0A6B2L0G3_9EUKA
MLVGSRGDVQPFIALSLELIKQGHTVTIATHEAHEKFVRSFETIRYAKLAGDPKELMKLCVENDMFSSSFIKEGLAHFKTFLRDLLTSGYQACKEGTDVIIQNPPAMAGVHIAEKLKIPLFVGFTMPWSRTKYFPHGFANSFGNSWTNYYTYVAIDFAMWMPIKDLFDDFRMKELNLPAASSTEGCSLVHTRKVPHLYCWSPSVLPKPRDWEDHIHITGYWFVDTTGHYKPPAALKEFLEKEPKALYIGFGSITIPDPDGLTHIILEALTETGQRAVISAGWGGLGIGNINNPNVYLLNEVPHDWLFPQVAAVIHHGGAGTTAAGLRAGVPTAIVPFFGDQYFWGSRIEQLGVGVPYTCIKYLTSKKLASIIKTLVTNQEMKDRAKSLGEHIRDQMGCTRAIEAIYLELNRWNDKNLNTTPNDTPNQEKEKEKEQVKEKDDDFFIVNTEQFNATISQVTRKTDEAGNEYAVYTIQVTTTYSQYKPPNWDSSTPCSFHIDKRYNQFCTLHKKLQQYATLAPLPVKDYWNRFSNNVIQSRKNAFNSLLEQISKDTKLILLPEVIDFLTKD